MTRTLGMNRRLFRLVDVDDEDLKMEVQMQV